MSQDTSAAKKKASKKRRRPAWLERLLAWLLAGVMACMRCLPLNAGRFLARGVGRAIYFLAGPDAANVGQNLRIAFGPNADEARVRVLAKGFWIHFCQAVVEAAHLSKWNAGNCDRYLDWSEAGKLASFKAEQGARGVILVSGHLGSWEVGPYAFALKGYPIHLLHNPGTVAPVFEYLKRQRERSGMKVLSRTGHPWKLKKLLDRGAWLCIAMDVNAGRKGVFVPFFGVPASTYLSTAALQQATGCPIVVTSFARQADGRHRFHIWRVIERKKSGDHEADLLRTTREMLAALEEAIRAYPEQWLWCYRRWRRRPPGEVPGADGLPPHVPQTGVHGGENTSSEESAGASAAQA